MAEPCWRGTGAAQGFFLFLYGCGKVLILKGSIMPIHISIAPSFPAQKRVMGSNLTLCTIQKHRKFFVIFVDFYKSGLVIHKI